MYNKNLKLDKENNKLNIEDLFNLVLIQKRIEGAYSSFNIMTLKNSFEIYSKSKELTQVYDYIEINPEKGFDFREIAKKNVINNNIILNDDYAIISLNLNKLRELKAKYNNEVYELFNNLIFIVSNDVKFGFGQWYNNYKNLEQATDNPIKIISLKQPYTK